MINRRWLLIWLTGAGVLAGAAGWRYARSSAEDAIAKVLQKRLAYLILEAGGVWEFARELARRNEIADYKLRAIAAAGRLYGDITLSGHGVVAEAIRRGEERIVTLYLLSSDFFIMGADQSRVVRYLGFYDAMRACSNPFARPVVQQQ